MKSSAKLSYLRISPRKVRLVANMVRGKDVVHAERQLHMLPKRAALPLLKLLRSAKANAGEVTDPLYISQIRVDGGPAYRRFRPRARGRAARIQKMTSHIYVELDEKGTKKGT